MPKRPSKIDPKDSLLVEADVEKQIVGFLTGRKWRVIRLRPRGKRGHARLGEVGASDYIVIRPRVPWLDGFFLEVKKPGEQPRGEQYRWMTERNGEGYRTVWVDNLKTFKYWYQRQNYS